MTDIALRTNHDEHRLSFEALHRVGRSRDFECRLVVTSSGFSTAQPFWFEEEQLTNFVAQLSAMDRDLAGSAELRTRYEESVIVHLEISHRGAVKVSGTVAQYSECSHVLQFCFLTDQTVLRPLVEDLNGLLLAPAT